MNDEDHLKKYLDEAIKINSYEIYKKQMMGDWDIGRQTTAMNADKHRIQELEKELNEKRHQVHDLKEDLLALKLELTSEQLLREKHPGLKELYNEYLAMLDLVKEY